MYVLNSGFLVTISVVYHYISRWRQLTVVISESLNQKHWLIQEQCVDSQQFTLLVVLSFVFHPYWVLGHIQSKKCPHILIIFLILLWIYGCLYSECCSFTSCKRASSLKQWIKIKNDRLLLISFIWKYCMQLSLVGCLFMVWGPYLSIYVLLFETNLHFSLFAPRLSLLQDECCHPCESNVIFLKHVPVNSNPNH